MKLDRVSAIFLFILGVVVFLKSLSYPLGNYRRPGGGLFPLIASILLMTLAATLTLQALLSKESKKAAPAPFFPEKDTPKRVLLGFVALLAYLYLLPLIGLGPSTFMFIFILSKFFGEVWLEDAYLFLRGPCIRFPLSMPGLAENSHAHSPPGLSLCGGLSFCSGLLYDCFDRGFKKK